MKQTSTANILKYALVVVVGFAVLSSAVLTFTWAFPEAFQAPTKPAVVARQRPVPTPVVVEPAAAVEPGTPQAPATQYATVEEYFSDGNPNPLTHRIGLGRFERDVSASHRKKIIKRDGGCCLVCGSTVKLEVDQTSCSVCWNSQCRL